MIKLPKKSIKHFSKNLKDIFNSGNLAEGVWNTKLEKEIIKITKIKYSLSTSSNGSGLLSILQLLKRYYGYKNIFIQENTMYGMYTLANTSGLKFIGKVDCQLNTLMPTINDVKKFYKNRKIRSRSVFLLTHIGGWINPDIEKIAKFCLNKNIALIEDCAHSLGSTFKRKHSGSFGFAGVYSFYATKAIPAGEGGLIVTNNKNFHNLCKKYSVYDRFEQTIDIGINNRMSEINALLCYSVLLELENIIDNKFKIADKYIKACNDNKINFLDPYLKFQRPNLYKFIILKKNINDLKLFKNKTSGVYDYKLGEDKNNISKKHLCLPIWYKLELSKINDVIKELNNAK